MSLARRYAILIAVAAVVLAADQASKALVVATLRGRPPIHLLGGAVLLTYDENRGAAFSILQAGGYLFQAVAIAVAIAILVLYPRIEGRSPAARIGNALLLGGALGNLADRIRQGYVVDFIDLRWWPVFNLADSAIVIGVLLLLAHSVWSERQR